MRWFALGGIIMWPLMACSLAALAVIIERLWYFFTIREDSSRLLQMVRESLLAGKVTATCYDMRTRTGPISRLVQESLVVAGEYPQADRQIVEARLTRAANKQLIQMEGNLKVLEVVGLVAPMLGLIGTVMGIMRSLSVLGLASGALKTQMLSTGLAEALIGTEVGLIIAAPSIIAHAYFSRRVDKMAGEMEQVGSELVEMLAAHPVPTNVAQGEYYATSVR